MNENHFRDVHDTRLFDALVDGELPARQRTDLLQRLDQMPGGWRQLSMAFLEAQEWRLALNVPDSNSRERTALAPRRALHRKFAWLGTGVAAALVSFWLGLSTDRMVERSTPQSASSVHADSPGIASATSSRAHDVTPTSLARTLTPAARQQLERLGFRVQERPRVVSIQQPDGQTVQVLVHEVELQFVGRPYSL